MVLERETKGALRYQEVDDQGKPKKDGYLIGTLYLRKSALSGTPAEIIVIVGDDLG